MINFENIIVGFRAYLESLQESGEKDYDLDSFSDVSIFMYSDEFKDYVTDQLDLDSQLGSMDLSELFSMDFSNNQFTIPDEEQTDNPSEDQDAGQQNFFTGLLNSLFKNDFFLVHVQELLSYLSLICLTIIILMFAPALTYGLSVGFISLYVEVFIMANFNAILKYFSAYPYAFLFSALLAKSKNSLICSFIPLIGLFFISSLNLSTFIKKIPSLFISGKTSKSLIFLIST